MLSKCPGKNYLPGAKTMTKLLPGGPSLGKHSIDGELRQEMYLLWSPLFRPLSVVGYWEGSPTMITNCQQFQVRKGSPEPYKALKDEATVLYRSEHPLLTSSVGLFHNRSPWFYFIFNVILHLIF